MDDINTRKKLQRGMKKANTLAKTMKAFGDPGSGSFLKSPPTRKKTLTSNGFVEIEIDAPDSEDEETDNRIRELRKMLDERGKSAKQQDRDRLRGRPGSLPRSPS